MQLRFLEEGYEPFLVRECYVREMVIREKHLSLFSRFDKQTLRSFWKQGKKYYKNRLSPVQKFVDKDILKYSQGEKKMEGYKKWR